MKSMVDLFMDMVRIDSESGNEEAFLTWLEPLFQELGARTERDAYGNLMAFLPGKNCPASCPPVLLSCHGDTVMPGQGIVPVLEDGVIRSQGETILGADDKAGIAELLETLRTAPCHPPLEMAISRQEEVGLLGVKNLDFSKLSATRGFLLDNDELETVVVGGPSYITLDVAIEGRAAHAGMEPEKGINAIQAASRAISALPLGRLDPRSTANVGVIRGGLIRNGVPDKTSFQAECRSLEHTRALEICSSMEHIIRKEVEAYGARVDIQTRILCEAVAIPEEAPTVQIALKALSMAGIQARTTFITGFTDASIYNNRGIEMAVVGIGARLEHSTQEHIHVRDMERAVLALTHMLTLCCQADGES